MCFMYLLKYVKNTYQWVLRLIVKLVFLIHKHLHMRGSEWRKWDFHVHTKGTNKNDQFSSSSMDEFFEIFFRKACELDIQAIGITDYFTIDNYLLAKEYVSKIESKVNTDDIPLFNVEEVKTIKDIFLFPNVELRMSPATDSQRLINIHCIFNPNYVTNLENDFFGSIENQDRIKMNRSGFINYGKKLNPNLDEHQAFIHGLNNYIIDPGTLKNLLDIDSKLRENTIVVVSNSNKDGNSALQKHYDLFEGEPGSLDGVRRTIYYISNCIFSTNKKDINYFLGKRLDDNDGITYDEKATERNTVLHERGSYKACLVGSDAHKEKDLFQKYTWVKADRTFEGLKQIIFEPEERVRIQDSEPDYKEEKNLIESVKFISDKKIFSPLPIKLNKNLNVIIGGKSSGKSILLYNIAKTLIKDKDFFKREEIDDKYDFYLQDPTYNFEITTFGGFKQKLIREDSEKSFLPDIKYLPQNYLVKLAEPHLNKKGETLLKLTRNLLKEDKSTYDSYQAFLQRVRANDNRIENIIDNLISYKDKGKLLTEDLSSKNSSEIIQKNIETNQNKIQELNKEAGLTDEEIAAYSILQTELQEINSEIEKFGNDYRKIISFNNETNATLNNIKSKKEILSNSLENNQTKVEFDNKYKELDKLIESLIKFNVDFEQSKELNKDNISGKVVSPWLEMKDITEKQLAKYSKGEEARTLIKDIEKSVNADKIALQAITQLKKEIEDNNKAQEIEHLKLITQYKENISEYRMVIEALSPRAEKLLNEGLKVKGLIKFNFDKFRKHISLVSHSTKLAKLAEYIYDKEKTALSEVDFNQLFQDLEKMCIAVENDEYPLLKNVNVKTALKTIFHDYFFDYWEVEYLNDKLDHMSTGKASFVILMLIIGLSESKAPILIDQPEDNLDNRSISNELVDYLRKKKVDRQIILVTHNANVVVNADAENIVVANQNGQTAKDTTSPYRFDYINGAIENTISIDETETDLLKSMGIREHTADIVEGGKEAFQKREKKYSFI